MQELELLQQKIEMLVKQYTTLQGAFSRLQKSFHAQAMQMKEQASVIAALQQELRDYALGSLSKEVEKEHLKTYLDYVIAEIDKNLKTLKK